MLETLGMIGGNILSLPGILGVALGMMTRNLFLAVGIGAFVGLTETFLFAGFSLSNIHLPELCIAVVVGMVAGALGCGIRIKGTTV